MVNVRDPSDGCLEVKDLREDEMNDERPTWADGIDAANEWANMEIERAHEIGFFELPNEPPSDVRHGLFNILKSIIDGERGPYTDEYYWEMTADAMRYLNLT